MGDPKKQRKKFSKPNHPWIKERIIAEKEIVKQHGLRRKYEIWKMESILKNLLFQAKSIIGSRTKQSDVEKVNLLNRVYNLGLLPKGSRVEDILNLSLKDILNRRLQTLVHRKNISSTVLQARQFIVHEHISIGDKKITAPSYLVTINEEPLIKLAVDSKVVVQRKEEKKIKGG